MSLKSYRWPIGPQTLDGVEEPMPACPATLKDPGPPGEIVLDQHSLTHFPSQHWCKVIPTTQLDTFPESALVQDVPRISRT